MIDPQSRIARLERLVAVSKRLVSEDDPARVLEWALDGVIEFVGADQGFALLREPDGRPRVRAARNLDRETVRGPHFRPFREIADHVLRTGEPFVSGTVGVDDRVRPSESLHDLARTVTAVPLRSSEQVIGVLYMDRLHAGDGAFEPDDLRVLQNFAETAARAIELRRRLHHLEAERARVAAEREALKAVTHNLHEEVAAKSVEIARFERAIDSNNRALGKKFGLSQMVGRSLKMRRIFDVLAQVADYPVPVLITGESGTGKELIARAVHYGGVRASEPFMAINCAAIPENLLESELFGYHKGAFTGANTEKIGLFRAAGRGTVFLDEVGELPLALQAKMLRVLQEREVRPLGSATPVPIEARILAATNREIATAVRNGTFREDLYYRIKVVEVEVPPLRERTEDIPALVQHFLSEFSSEMGLPPQRLSAQAIQRLVREPWPGNVRQLENVIKSTAILNRDAIIGADALQGLALPTPSSPARVAAPHIQNRVEWEAHERGVILQALVRCNWNKTKAAVELSMSRRNLYRKLSRYGIEGAEE